MPLHRVSQATQRRSKHAKFNLMFVRVPWNSRVTETDKA
jgi:hypothetical protein